MHFYCSSFFPEHISPMLKFYKYPFKFLNFNIFLQNVFNQIIKTFFAWKDLTHKLIWINQAETILQLFDCLVFWTLVLSVFNCLKWLQYSNKAYILLKGHWELSFVVQSMKSVKWFHILPSKFCLYLCQGFLWTIYVYAWKVTTKANPHRIEYAEQVGNTLFWNILDVTGLELSSANMQFFFFFLLLCFLLGSNTVTLTTIMILWEQVDTPCTLCKVVASYYRVYHW